MMQIELERESYAKEEETYTCQEFIQEVNNLSQASLLYHCSFDEFQLMKIYEQTLEQFGVKTMGLSLIQQFINNLREKNKEDILVQLAYFKAQLKKKVLDNIQVLSRRQLWKIIGAFQGEEGKKLISQLLTQKSRDNQYISCKKIVNLLEEIQQDVEDGGISGLSPQKLEGRRISEEKVEVHGNISGILDIFEKEKKIQLEKYFQFWRRKMQFVYQFIGDEEIKYQVQTFLQDVRQAEKDIVEEVQNLEDRNEDLNNTCLEYEEVNQKVNEQIDLYQDMANERKKQVLELNLQIKHLERQIQRSQEQNQTLNQAMEEGRANLVHLSSQYASIEEQLNDYKQKYNEIYSQYLRMAKAQEESSMIAKKQEQTKIFSERTMKQQLDDALHKFNRLLKERQTERKKFAKRQQQNTTRIEVLETKLMEMQEEMKNKNEKLNDYIRESKIYNFRNSIVNSKTSMRSGLLGSGNSGIFEFPESKLVMSTIKKKNAKESQILVEDRNSQIQPLRVSTQIIPNAQNRLTALSKMKKADIAAEDLPEIVEEQDASHIIDNTTLPPEQNLTTILEADTALFDFSSDNNKNIKKPVKKKELSQKKQSIMGKADLKIAHFISKGILINIHGVKTETTFLLTNKRFCFFDSKMRLSRFIPIQNIKCFIFCRTNPTLFILRPKNVHQLNSKEHFTNPIIVSTRNRASFASYLTKKVKKLLNDNQIQLMTRFEDDIFLKVDNQEINVKHKIPNMKNPYRLSLSHVPVFYARLQEQGLLNFKYTAVVVIQPAGIFCFEGTEVGELESGREFLYMLPLDECKIGEKEDSKQAPGRKVKIGYQTDSVETYYSMIFASRQELKLFLKACEEQIKSNDSHRKDIQKKLDESFKK